MGKHQIMESKNFTFEASVTQNKLCRNSERIIQKNNAISIEMLGLLITINI